MVIKPVLALLLVAAFVDRAEALEQPAAPPPASAVRTFVGHPVGDAAQSEFVRFFHLEQTRSAPDPSHPGTTLTTYGSTGPFKGVATLALVSRDDDPAVVVAALMVRRDFVDNPRTQPFARDIVKSFLEASTGADDPQVKTLRTTVWRCQAANVPDCEATPPAYRVFTGASEKEKLLFAGGYVMLQNTNKVLGVPMLFVENGSDNLPAAKAAD